MSQKGAQILTCSSNKTSMLMPKLPIRRPPNPKTTDQESLYTEIENKSKACSNSTFECTIPRIEGYEFCVRHILQDPRAPYKQCTFSYSNGKKCTQAAPKNDSKKDPIANNYCTSYCFEHSRLVGRIKTKNTIGTYKTTETNETLLNDLTHHLSIEKARSGASQKDPDEEIDVVSANAEPYVSYEQITELSNLLQNVRNKKRILDYASDSSSDDESPTLQTTSKSYECDNSDDESVDSQDDDLLKHAGIYTTEEATLIAKQKMMKLQSLYVGQIDRLHHILKEKRRKYLLAIRKERETLCSIHDQTKDTPQERRVYEKLKSLNHYHHRYGVEAVLHKKFKEKRSRLSSCMKGPHPLTKCSFIEGGVKCLQKQIPCSKYCKKHILEDKRQTLFRACGVEKSGIICQEPVPNVSEDATCALHIEIPHFNRIYTQKKYESETEEEEEIFENLKQTDHSVIIKDEEVKLEEEIIFDTSMNITNEENSNISQEMKTDYSADFDDISKNKEEITI